MTQLESGQIKRFRGTSDAPKPGERVDFSLDEGRATRAVVPPVGSTYTEIDTGRRFIWTAENKWVRQQQTVEELLNAQIDLLTRILERLDATHRGHEEYLWEEEIL